MPVLTDIYRDECYLIHTSISLTFAIQITLISESHKPVFIQVNYSINVLILSRYRLIWCCLSGAIVALS